jgi:hypothetical protein
MSQESKIALLAIGVPFVGVLGGVVALAGSAVTILGFPVVFAWLFLWMPLTTLCLHLAWRVEAPNYEGCDETAADVGR